MTCPSPSEVNQTHRVFQVLKDEVSRHVKGPIMMFSKEGCGPLPPTHPWHWQPFRREADTNNIGSQGANRNNKYLYRVQILITRKESVQTSGSKKCVFSLFCSILAVRVLQQIYVLLHLSEAAMAFARHWAWRAARAARGGPAGEEPPKHALHRFFSLLLHFILAFCYDSGSCNKICKVMEVLGLPDSTWFGIKASKGQNLLHDGPAENSPFQSKAAVKCCGKSHQALLRTGG